MTQCPTNLVLSDLKVSEIYKSSLPEAKNCCSKDSTLDRCSNRRDPCQLDFVLCKSTHRIGFKTTILMCCSDQTKIQSRKYVRTWKLQFGCETWQRLQGRMGENCTCWLLFIYLKCFLVYLIPNGTFEYIYMFFIDSLHCCYTWLYGNCELRQRGDNESTTELHFPVMLSLVLGYFCTLPAYIDTTYRIY